MGRRKLDQRLGGACIHSVSWRWYDGRWNEVTGSLRDGACKCKTEGLIYQFSHRISRSASKCYSYRGPDLEYRSLGWLVGCLRAPSYYSDSQPRNDLSTGM